ATVAHCSKRFVNFFRSQCIFRILFRNFLHKTPYFVLIIFNPDHQCSDHCKKGINDDTDDPKYNFTRSFHYNSPFATIMILCKPYNPSVIPNVKTVYTILFNITYMFPQKKEEPPSLSELPSDP